MKDFFISYTKADQSWAEWIAWQLENVGGYTTVIQAWDFHAGSNFISAMQLGADHPYTNIVGENLEILLSEISSNYVSEG